MRLPLVAILAALPRLAAADGGPDYFRAPTGKDIVITTEGERTTQNIAALAGVAGAGVVVGALGLYFHLDSRDAANAVSTKTPKPVTWTPADQLVYDRAHDSAVKAGVFYGIGGALVIGAIIGLIVTEPKSETTVIHPHGNPTVTPTAGGALLGGTWTF